MAFLAGRSKPHSSNAGNVAAASSPATSPAASSAAATSSAANTASASQTPGAATMSAIGNDLAQSASARSAVAAAIGNVQNCSESPSSAETTLQQSITTRQTILAGLPGLSTAGLPNGAELVSDFTTAEQNSLNADNAYYAWLQDLVSSGATCGSNSSQDSNYQNALTADTASTSSKQAFVDVWNPIAPSYGQQTYTAGNF
jgi:eukaryotic-like serine/threonine-protein kinase